MNDPTIKQPFEIKEATVKEASMFMTDAVINFAANLGTGKDKRSYTSWGRNTSRGAFGNDPNGAIGVYGYSLTQDRVKLENMYSGDWLSGKIIDIPVEDMLRQWRKFDFGKDNAKLQKRFVKAERRFGVKEQIRHALKWGRLYGGAGIILGVDGCGDASLPLDVRSIPPGGLKFIKAVDRWHLTPQDINYYDISRNNYFRPNSYRITGTGQLIHHTRVLRFGGVEMPNYVAIQNYLWDDSVLTRFEDALLNAVTTPNILNSLLFEANVPVLQVPNLAQILSSDGGEQRLQKRAALMNFVKSFANMIMLDEKETYENKSLALSGLNAFADLFFQIVSGASDIPIARLMGHAIAVLNSTGEQDIRNYYDGLKSKQESQLTDPLETIDAAIMMSEFGGIVPGYSFEFNPLWQMTDKERADIAKTQADTDAIYLQNDVLSPNIIAKELKTRGTYTAIDDEFIEEVSSEFVNRYDPSNPERTPSITEDLLQNSGSADDNLGAGDVNNSF